MPGRELDIKPSVFLLQTLQALHVRRTHAAVLHLPSGKRVTADYPPRLVAPWCGAAMLRV